MVKKATKKTVKKSSIQKPSIKTQPKANRNIFKRAAALRARRPHRSFQLSRRRDYVRSLRLPGYWSFTLQVFKTLARHKKLFLLLGVFYASLVALFGGVTDQTTYSQINDLIKSSSGGIFSGGLGSIAQSGLLFVSAFAGGSSQVSSDQQIYLTLALLFVWLTSVWLLREIMAGRRPKLRDGLYNAGAPVVATLLLFIVLIIQLLPVGIMALIYAGLSSVGLISGGLGSMLFYIVASLVVVMVLYWISGTLLALVVVTLPGVYPMQALRAAGDLVVGRRLRIVYRLLFMVLVILLAWAIVMLPLVTFDSWLSSVWPPFDSVPLLPGAVAVASSLTTIWCSSYVYLLYRRIVDDDAKPV